jgi:hypothetical protein
MRLLLKAPMQAMSQPNFTLALSGQKQRRIGAVKRRPGGGANYGRSFVEMGFRDQVFAKQQSCVADVCLMSALPPKADMDQHGRDVRFVPKADIQ